MFYSIRRFFVEIRMFVVSNIKILFDAMCSYESNMVPTRRRLLFKEFKLKVTNWYFENEKNINQTANNFLIDRKQVRN